MAIKIEKGKIVGKITSAEQAAIKVKVDQLSGGKWNYDVYTNTLEKDSNTVSLDLYTFEEAVKMLNSLKNCRKCVDSYNLTNCKKCIDCVDCEECSDCFRCERSEKLKRCEECINCYNCINCSGLEGAEDQRNLHESLDEAVNGFIITDGELVLYVDDDNEEVDFDDLSTFTPSEDNIFTNADDAEEALKELGNSRFKIMKVKNGKVMKNR